MLRTRVKICGMTCIDDAHGAVDAGADALGLVFYPPSPRAVSVHEARQVVAGVAPLVTWVGLFVNADVTAVDEACNAMPLGLLQFHGDETPEYCSQFGMPWMKALRVAPDMALERELDLWQDAHAVLLDTYVKGQPGGTGLAFDWQKIPGQRPAPLVLAGGLTAATVGAAIDAVQPFAVDVSGGVESTPGRKDSGEMELFVAAVQAADRKKREKR